MARWYFAYGSNMFAAQMRQRCPGAGNPIHAILRGHAWLCNERGVATIVPVDGRDVHGVVWDVTADHLASLDRHEGVAAGRYRRATVRVTTASGSELDAVAYIDDRTDPGPPRPGYLERVLDGAREHHLPAEWLEYLRRWVHVPVSPVRRAGPTSGPSTLAALLAVPGVVETAELRSRFGFVALHGGELETATDVIATRAAAASGASYYGVAYPATLDHHLPSTAYDPADSMALGRFLDHVDVVISIHGYGRRGRWTELLAGGSNRELARHVAAHLAARLDGYEVVTDVTRIPSELRGAHPQNPVNVPPSGGVQLELPPRVRGLSPLSPPAGSDGLSAPTRSLIDGLTAAAHTWPAPPANSFS